MNSKAGACMQLTTVRAKPNQTLYEKYIILAALYMYELNIECFK